MSKATCKDPVTLTWLYHLRLFHFAATSPLENNFLQYFSPSGEQQTEIMWNEEVRKQQRQRKSFMLDGSSPRSKLWHDLEMEHFKGKQRDSGDTCVKAECLTHNLTHLRCRWWAVLQNREGVGQKQTTGENKTNLKKVPRFLSLVM